jgi:hypothetical protein
MRKTALLFGTLVLAGVLLYGYGMSVPSHTHHVDVDGTVDADAVEENATVVNYEGLSEEKQQVFDEARTSDATVETPVWHSRGVFVRHQGEYYQVDRGGTSTGNNILYFSAGMVVTWLGITGLAVLEIYWTVRKLERRRVFHWLGRTYERLRRVVE